MAEYIERELVLKTIRDNFCAYFPNVLDVVKRIPSTDVQPVKHGRWESTDNPSFRKCSECGAWWSRDITDNYFTNYCPKCGAKNER